MTMRLCITAFAATSALCIISSPALAQARDGQASGSAKVSEKAEQAYREASQAAATHVTNSAAKVATAGAPNERAGSGFSSSSLQFSSELGETDVSLAFGFDLRASKPDPNEIGFANVGSTKITVTLSTPIDKKNITSRLFSGDSLVSGSKGRFSLVHFSTKLGDGRGASAMLADAYKRCFSDQTTAWLNGRTATTVQADQQVVLTLQRDAQTGLTRAASSGAFDGTIDNLTTTVATDSAATIELKGFVKEKCQMGGSRFGNEGALMAAYSDQSDAFLAKFFPKRPKLRFYGLDASIGREDFSFLDRTAFKLQEQARTTWELGAYAGIIGGDLSYSARARVVYGQGFEANPEAEICRTVSIPAGQECLKGPDGTPLRKRTGLASIEARKLIALNATTTVAIAPQATYKFDDKSLGLEMPIYLSPDKDGKLSGGLKLAYNSKGDDFGIGLFVGIPFSIFYD